MAKRERSEDDGEEGRVMVMVKVKDDGRLWTMARRVAVEAKDGR